MNWLWTWPATLIAAEGTLKSVNSLMEKYPDFHFSQSQTAIYSTIEKKYPPLFNKIKKWVKEGRWDITASTWVEGDLNMASGESLVRQILYAKKYIKEKFGIEPKACWCPDTFGHSWTYPQILKKSGIDYIMVFAADLLLIRSFGGKRRMAQEFLPLILEKPTTIPLVRLFVRH